MSFPNVLTLLVATAQFDCDALGASCQSETVRSTRNQKLLAVSIIVLALLLLTPLAEVAVGVALLAALALVLIRFYPRPRDQGR